MILKNKIKLGFAISCLVLSVHGWAQTDEPPGNALTLEPCTLTLPGTPVSGPAECGELTVPENPAAPEGRQISLNIARVPASSRKAEPDPLFLFAGGPGQAATEAWLIVARALRKVNESRDIILIDQRGTGKSNPLKCPDLDVEDTLSSDWDALGDLTRECLDGINGDPRFYTTTIGMQDYDTVREALGYDQINLWGASYGTRSAQVYMRMYPDRVRTAVLDSVVPQELPLGIDHAVMLDKAVFRVLENCEQDDDCASQFPNTAQQLRDLAAALELDPVETTLNHPSTGKPLTLDFDRDALAASLRFLMYSPSSQALLPLLISEAASDGDFSRLASQMLISTSGLAEMISMGMEMSVTCSEDFPFFPEDTQAGLLLGNTMIEASKIRCGIWPRGDVPSGFHDPVVSDKPVLLLSGELDPVTPPEYADQVAEHMPNSVHVIAPGQGHSVTGRGCLGDIVADFINAASVENLETDCVNQLSTTPFFINLTGPKP